MSTRQVSVGELEPFRELRDSLHPCKHITEMAFKRRLTDQRPACQKIGSLGEFPAERSSIQCPQVSLSTTKICGGSGAQAL